MLFTNEYYLNQKFCIFGSLRSKRFRGVWEQRKTEERDFRCFARAKNGARAKNRKRWFRASKTPKSRSFDSLCSPAPRKRLLRRLYFRAYCHVMETEASLSSVLFYFVVVITGCSRRQIFWEIQTDTGEGNRCHQLGLCRITVEQSNGVLGRSFFLTMCIICVLFCFCFCFFFFGGGNTVVNLVPQGQSSCSSI